MSSYTLEKWTTPDSYLGPDFFEYYVFLGQNRDSDALTRSNFTCALDMLGGESVTVKVIRQGHWACGWIELIMIHESDIKALEIAKRIIKDLEDYPVLDESHWSELEYNEACDYWVSLPLDERRELCTKYRCTLNEKDPDCMPSDDDGSLQQYLNGN